MATFTDVWYGYGLLWCLHQMAPFLDKVLAAVGILGQAGAVDHRPIYVVDWLVRLPLVVLALLAPSERTLAIAHASSLAMFVVWAPQNFDHQNWAAVIEVSLLVCWVHGDAGRTFLPVARTQMLCLYLCAAYWKLTTSFLGALIGARTPD